MAIETIGFKAVVDNLQGYLAAVNQIAASNTRLAQSELNYAKAAVTADSRIANLRRQQIAAQGAVVAAVQSGQARINEFNIRSTDIATRLAQREVQARLGVEKANRVVSNQIQKSGKATEAALERQANAAIRLDNTLINNAARASAVSRSRGRLETQVSNEVAAAELRRLAVDQQVARVSIQNDLAETSSNLKLAAAREVAAAAAAKEAAAATAAAARPAATGLRGLALAAPIAALGAFRLAARTAEAATSLFGRALIAVTGFSNRFAVSIRFGTAAILAFSTALAIGTASQFETTLLKINNLTESTTAETEQFKDELLELSKVIPKTPDELGAGLYFILSSGIKDAGQAFDILELSAKASVAGLGEVDAVTRVLTQTINAYGSENISAAQAADILFATAREGSAEVEDLTNSLGRVTTPAAQLGIEFDELGAAIAALTNAGLPANQAITAILGITNQLLDPAAEAKDLLIEYGTSLEELQVAVADKGLIPALRDLLVLFDGNREVLTTLFPEIRGLVGAFALLSNDSRLFEQAFDGVSRSVGVVDEAFERASETFTFQAGLIKNILNRALIEIGSVVLPKVAKAFQDVGKFIDENRESIGQFLRVLQELGNGFLQGVKVISQFTFSLLGAKGTIAAVALAIGIFTLLVLGPWITGIFAVVTAVGILSANFDKFRNKAIEVWGSLPAIVTEPLKLISGNAIRVVNSIVEIFGNIYEGFKEAIDLVKNAAANDWDAVWENIKNIAELALENLVVSTEVILGAIVSIFENVGARAINAFIASIEAGINKLQEIDVKNFLPPPLNSAIPDTGINIKVGEVTLPRIDVPEIEFPELPELKKSLDDTRKAVKQTSDETTKFGNQSLADVKTGLQNAATAAEEFKKALDSALSDRQISFEEALELDLDAITAGALEASVALNLADEEAFNFTKTLARVANVFKNSALEAQRLVLDIARDALGSVRSATSAVFGRSSREILTLERSLLRLSRANDQAVRGLGGYINAINRQARALNNFISIGLEAELGILDERLAALDKQERAEALAGRKQDLSDLESQAASVAAEIARIERTRNRPISSVDDLESLGSDIKELPELQRELANLNNQISDMSRDLQRTEIRQSIEDQKQAIQEEINAKKAEEEAIQNRIQFLQDENQLMQLNIELADKTLFTQEQLRQKADELQGAMFNASGAVVALSDILGVDVIPEMEDMRRSIELLNGVFGVINDEDIRKGFIRNVDAASLAAERFSKALDEATAALGPKPVPVEPEVTTILEQIEVLKQSQFGPKPPTGTLTPAGPAITSQEIFEVLAQSQFQITTPLLEKIKTTTTDIVAGLKDTADPLIKNMDGLLTPTKDLASNISDLFEPLKNLDTSVGDLLTPMTSLKALVSEMVELIKAEVKGTVEDIVGQQHGGLITKPTVTLRGEHHLPELVLPLSEPNRSRELLMSLPPSLAAQITPRQGTQFGSLFGNVSVQGIITPEIEHMVNREVRRQLNKPRAGLKAIGL